MFLGLCSCSETTPSGFWKSFKTDYLKENISNQGLHGGYRATYWEATQGVFTPQEIIAYADKNGWELIDSLEVQTGDMNKWIYDNKPIFPLSEEGFSAKPVNSSTHKNFPR